MLFGLARSLWFGALTVLVLPGRSLKLEVGGFSEAMATDFENIPLAYEIPVGLQ